ncbi:MAG: hypothetical protein WD669_02255 [Pirellulales bacterium]
MSRRARRHLSVCLLICLFAATTSKIAEAQVPPPLGANPAPAPQNAQELEQQQRAQLEQALRAQQDEMGVQPRGGGGRRRGRGRGQTAAEEDFLRQSILRQNETPRSAPAVESPPPLEVPHSTEPRDLIALNLWVLTVEAPRDKAAEDLTASLLARSNDLPLVIGTRDDVRVLVGKLTVAGLLARSREFRVIALNGQPVSIQSGGNQPRIVVARGGGQGGGGGGMNQVQYQSVGTNISFLPRVVAGGNVDVQLYLTTNEQEEARNVPVAVGPDGNPITATRTTNQQLQTTARVKAGAAVLVQSDALADPGNELSSIRTQLIILGATIVPALE